MNPRNQKYDHEVELRDRLHEQECLDYETLPEDAAVALSSIACMPSHDDKPPDNSPTLGLGSTSANGVDGRPFAARADSESPAMQMGDQKLRVAQAFQLAIKLQTKVSQDALGTKERARTSFRWTGMHKKKHIAASVIQSMYRRRLYHGMSLHRSNLIERLKLEMEVIYGAARLVNIIILFSLLLLSLALSDNSQTKNGIRTNLDTVFDFEAVESINNKVDLWRGLSDMASKSYQFFPRSAQVYQSSSSAMTLVPDLHTYQSELSYVLLEEIPVDLSALTFTAWVQVDDGFEGGYILRKVTTPASAASGILGPTVCYGWAINRDQSVSLRYGGHQYYSTAPNYVDAMDEEPLVDVTFELSSHQTLSDITLLTLVVTKEAVSLFYNLERVGTKQIPFPLSDCMSEQIRVGADRMTIGRLQYYPMRLEAITVREVFEHGAPLSMLSTGSQYVNALGEPSEEPAVAAVDDSASVQDSIDVSFVVSQAGAEGEAATSPAAGSDAGYLELGFGGVEAESAELFLDNVTGLRYYPILRDQYLLTNPGPSDAPRYFDRTNFPPLDPTEGTTIMFWLKANPSSPYQLAAQPSQNTSRVCWGVWMNVDGYGILTEDANRTVRDFVDVRGALRSQAVLTSQLWRHCTFVLNVSDNSMTVYLDGEMLGKHTLSMSLAEGGGFDCASAPHAVVGLGHSFPGNQYGGEVSMADLRVYPKPVTGDEVKLISLGDQESTVSRSCTPSETAADSTTWVDKLGNTCSWYNLHRESGVCASIEALENCELSCSSGWCYRPNRRPVYYLWNKIQYLHPQAENGSVCLSTKHTKEEVIAQCKASLAEPGGGEAANDYIQALKIRRTARSPIINLTDCDALAEHIDDTCGFDADVMKQFTEEVRRNGGDYTVFFWVRPANLFSFDEYDQFLPSITFLSSVSPPTSNLNIVAQHQGQGSDKLQFQYHSACDNSSALHEINMYEHGVLDPEGWTLMTMVLRNSTNPASGRMRAGMNMASYDQPGIAGDEDWVQCLGGDTTMLFTAMEVNTPMLVSPIGLAPWVLEYGDQQQDYLLRAPLMERRPGPFRSLYAIENLGYPVTKKPFLFNTAAVSTPIIFQTRVEPRDECSVRYSRDWVEKQHKKAIADHCNEPLQCSDAAVSNPNSFMACSGDEATKPFFGINQTSFQGVRGYADFLYSLSSNKFVSRENKLLSTDNFIVRETSTILVVYVFYSAELGCTSVLQVSANLDGVREAVAKVTLDHILILEGKELLLYLIVQSLNMVNIIVMGIDCFRVMYFQYKETARLPGVGGVERIWLALRRVSKVAYLDMLLVTCMLLFVTIRMTDAQHSASITRTKIDELVEIPWTNSNIIPSEKTGDFLSSLEDILDLVRYEKQMTAWCVLLLALLLARTIIATNCHPRLALLTGTLSACVDDMWHTFLLVLLMQCFFAGFSTWAFGSYREDFFSFNAAMQTQFQMMFGDFQENWTEDYIMIFYTVGFMMIIFLMVLNFVLAIVVEAYMKVRSANEVLEVEADFVSDVWGSSWGKIYAMAYKWPVASLLIAKLEKLPSRKPVDLLELFDSNLFCNHLSAVKFLTWYRRYRFLLPVRIQDPEYERQVNEIEKRMCWLLGRCPPSRADRLRYSATKWDKATMNHHQLPNVNLLYSALDVVRGDCAQLRHENQRLHEESLYLRAKTDSLEAKSDELLGLVRHLVTAQRAEAVEQVHLSESGSNHHRNIGGSENHEFHELGGQQPHLSDALQQSAPVAAHIVASRMLDRDALTSAQPDAL